MTASNSTKAPPLAIHVSTADDAGWIVTIDRAGRTVATERYTDWHRVERRIAILRLPVGPDRLRIAATWMCASILGACFGA